MPKFKTFKEFWPWYLEQHRNPVNIALHVLATLCSVTYSIGALNGWIPFHFAVFFGVTYGPSWVGHFAFERNKPATFHHPFWSLLADFRMCGRILTFKKMSP